MVYKLQNAGSLPRWMQKLNSWLVPDSDESAGERILNSTIERANNAPTQEERDKIYKDSAKANLATTGLSLMAPQVIKFASTPLGKKFIVDTTASITGGNLIDQASKKITGNPFGRWLASNFNATNAYDNSTIAQFGFDSLNPGYWTGGLVQKAASLPLGGLNRFNISKGNLQFIPWSRSMGYGVPESIKPQISKEPLINTAALDIYPNGSDETIIAPKQVFDDSWKIRNYLAKNDLKNTYPGFLKKQYLGFSPLVREKKLYFSGPKVNQGASIFSVEKNMRKLGYRRAYDPSIWVDTNSGNALYNVFGKNVGTKDGKFVIIDAEIAPYKYNVTKNPAYVKPEINTNSSIIGSVFGSSINNE